MMTLYKKSETRHKPASSVSIPGVGINENMMCSGYLDQINLMAIFVFVGFALGMPTKR